MTPTALFSIGMQEDSITLLGESGQGLSYGEKCSVVCIQETKLQLVTRTTIQVTMGQDFVDHFAMLPANGTRGGIILTCSHQYYELSHVHVRQFSVTVQIKRRIDNEE
jgi:hypothetical protein